MNSAKPEFLASEILDRAFPFHFAVTTEGRITHAGPRLHQIAGTLLGTTSFFDLNALDSTLPMRDFNDLRSMDGEMQVVELPSLNGIRLRGQFIFQKHTETMLFLGHPWITDLSELEGHGLLLHDFPANSGVAELLILLQARNNSVEEMRGLAARVREASKQLEVRNLELEDELTNRARLEEQLLQSQKMQAIGQLASGVAHDFNNVLLAISGHATLGCAAEDITFARRHFHAIQEASTQAADITARLLVYARQKQIEIVNINLEKAIKESISMLGPLMSDEVHIELDLDPNATNVRSDSVALQQVIVNLIVNARDSMPKGGIISVRTRHEEAYSPQDMFGSSRPPGSWNVIEVADSGIGMDETTLSRIFEPFFSTKEAGKGTGLGLSTVWGIVERSSGYIDVVSKPEKGTTFSIHLPSIDEPLDQDVRTPTSTTHNSCRRMLLVEDDDLVRRTISEVLTYAGWSVVSASCGEQALQKLQSNDCTFDLLVTDLSMPGMSGRELGKAVRASHPELKIIYVSGFDPDFDDPRAESIKVLSKPFTMEELEHAYNAL